MRIALTALFAATLATTALAQDLTHKAPAQSHLIAIVHATIHPVSGPEIADGAIWFDKGVIAHVGPASDWADLKTRARFASPPVEIDASGKHIYPGLFGPYTQQGLLEIQAVPATIDTRELGGIAPEVRATVAVNPDSTVLPVTRANGVLLAGVFPEGGIIPGRCGVIRLDGWTRPDLTVREDSGVVLRWPNMRPVSAWWNTRSDDEQLKEIKANLDAITKVSDTAQAYAAAKAADPASPTDLRWEAMRSLFPSAAKDAPPPVGTLFVLADDIDQINAAVTFCAERGVRCVLVGGRDAALCAPLLKEHKVSVLVSGTFVMPGRDDAPYDDGYSLPKRLFDAGIPFAIAGGDETAHERNLPYAAAMAAAHGLTQEAAIRAITLSPAEMLGVADHYGSLEEGKSATLIVTTGNPLEVETHVTQAFIDGREIDLSNKQTELAKKYRERYRQTGDLKDGKK
ncbi:MAG: amidohydrolase family protein [Phycisphaerales bacterium]|jgi:imidazolonepropionase-like amidohydrolase